MNIDVLACAAANSLLIFHRIKVEAKALYAAEGLAPEPEPPRGQTRGTVNDFGIRQVSNAGIPNLVYDGYTATCFIVLFGFKALQDYFLAFEPSQYSSRAIWITC